MCHGLCRCVPMSSHSFRGTLFLVAKMILGYFSANRWLIAIETWGWRIDTFSSVDDMELAAGVMTIFKPNGFSKWTTRDTLSLRPIAWTLLVILALYKLLLVLCRADHKYPWRILCRGLEHNVFQVCCTKHRFRSLPPSTPARREQHTRFNATNGVENLSPKNDRHSPETTSPS